MDKQPEALLLADALEQAEAWPPSNFDAAPTSEAAAELRRLHALNAELVEALRKALNEFSCLPHSLGYDFTHAPELRALIAKAEAQQ